MYGNLQALFTSFFLMLVVYSLKFWKCKQVEIWTGWWNMRSQIDSSVISLGNSIKEACCFLCGFTVFAQSDIYIIYFEAMQNDVRKRAKGGFVQEKLLWCFCFFFCKSWRSFLSQSFLTTFWIVSCLSRMRCISVCFDLERSNTGIKNAFSICALDFIL